MLKIFLVLATLGLNSMALADGGHHHTETVCSAVNAAVCAHLGIHDTLTSSKEGQFIAHVETPSDALISDMAVTLWMPDMGHGSAPVDIKDAGLNHFQVTNAWFPMTGKWIVKLDFKFEGAQHHIEIPVEIVN